MHELWRAAFYKMPKVGDVYCLADANPFKKSLVKVIDTRQGWVKFTRIESSFNYTSEVSRSVFHFMYVKEEQNADNTAKDCVSQKL